MIAAAGQVRTFAPRPGAPLTSGETALHARIEGLEEEIRAYRRDAGLEADQQLVPALQDVFRLSTRQALVLSLLLNARGRVVSRSLMMDAIYEGRDEAEAKILDVWITKIRKQLGKASIATVWGSGYRLTDAGLALCEKRLAARAKAPVVTITLESVLAMADADLDNLAALVRKAQFRRQVERARART